MKSTIGNRDIRYKAWCSIEKKMYEDFYVGDSTETFVFMNEIIQDAQKRYVFLEYTGF